MSVMTATATSNQKTTRIKLPALHNSQKVIKRGMGRYNVVCAGRRFGKDILAQDRAIRVGGYKRQPVGWFAPSYRMLTENYKMLNNTLSPIVTRKLDNTLLELVGGGLIEFWSLENPDRARGRKYAHVIVNEAAMVGGLMDAYNMVISPMLIDLAGSIDFYSTPKGLNDFYSLWQMALDIKGWERFKYTTWDNPTLPHEEIEAIASAMPERVRRQEIEAEFLEDGAYFQNVENAAVITERDQPEQHKGHAIYGGLDWAISEDFTVLAIGCRDCNRVVDWDRFNQIDFTYQRERVIERVQRWGAYLLPERNSIGLPNIELLRDRVRVMSGHDGMPGFMTMATTKPEMIQRLASGLEHNGFLVPREAADELRMYQAEMTSAGKMKLSAPSGLHDDWVIGLGLLYWAMTKTVSPIGMVAGV